LTAFILSVLTVISISVEPPVSYDEIVDEAMFDCKNVKWEDVDETLLWSLAEAEKRYGVPPSMRGMILASACHESGYNTNAKGDWRVVGKRGKRRARALGLFQMWPWWEKQRGYGIDRTDSAQTPDAYLKHITKQLTKVQRKCKIRSERKLWVTAWVTAIRSPKPGGRCGQKPKHYRLLRRWHRNILKARKFREEGCGC
jgi:hypothetical protein